MMKIEGMVLDGNGSIFELKFLEYITHENQKWNVYIGVLYGIDI